MKIQIFKTPGKVIIRSTLTGEEMDKAAAEYIARHGSGLCEFATTKNTTALFPSPDRTFNTEILDD
jgi:hypothetical protein